MNAHDFMLVLRCSSSDLNFLSGELSILFHVVIDDVTFASFSKRFGFHFKESCANYCRVMIGRVVENCMSRTV